MLINYLIVAFGAIFGVFARVFLTKWIKEKWKGSFPLATFLINLSGAFILGLVTGTGLPDRLALLAGTGFVGTYTTFSTWMIEGFELQRRRHPMIFWSYLAGTALFGIAAVFVGMKLGHVLQFMR
ncbi:MAG: CrcB family protein [Sporolactobacillus sp.]